MTPSDDRNRIQADTELVPVAPTPRGRRLVFARLSCYLSNLRRRGILLAFMFVAFMDSAELFAGCELMWGRAFFSPEAWGHAYLQCANSDIDNVADALSVKRPAGSSHAPKLIQFVESRDRLTQLVSLPRGWLRLLVCRSTLPNAD